MASVLAMNTMMGEGKGEVPCWGDSDGLVSSEGTTAYFLMSIPKIEK